MSYLWIFPWEINVSYKLLCYTACYSLLGSCWNLRNLNFKEGLPETLGNLPHYAPDSRSICIVELY